MVSSACISMSSDKCERGIQVTSMSMEDCSSIPTFFLNDRSGIAWESLRGKGLPCSFSPEWHAIVSLFVNVGDDIKPAQRNDNSNIARFLGANYNTFQQRLYRDINQRAGKSKLPEGSRINKPKRKTMVDSSEEAPTTSAAAAAEESSRPPAGATQPRLLALARRRGARLPPDGFCVGRRRRRMSRRPAALPLHAPDQ